MTAKPSPRAKKLSLAGAAVALAALLYSYVPTGQWDHLRHWLAYSLAADHIGPILGALLIAGAAAAVILVILRPSFRGMVVRFLHSHLGAFLASLVEQEVKKQLPAAQANQPQGSPQQTGTPPK